MGFLDRVLGDLMQDAGGRHARRLLRRVGGKKLLLAGGVAAADAILNPSTGAPRGSGYGFTKGTAVATATPPPAVPPEALPPLPGMAAGPGLPRGSAQPLSGAGESPAGAASMALGGSGTVPTGTVPPPPGPATTLPPSATSGSAEVVPGAVPPPPPAPPTLSVPSPLAGAGGESVADPLDPTALEITPAITFAAVRTMISAALSDGHLGAEERAAVEGRLSEADLTADEVARIQKDLVLPASPRELAELSRDEEDRELLYQLAVAVVAADGQVLSPERDWLRGLAAAFDLSAETVSALEVDVLDELATDGEG